MSALSPCWLRFKEFTRSKIDARQDSFTIQVGSAKREAFSGPSIAKKARISSQLEYSGEHFLLRAIVPQNEVRAIRTLLLFLPTISGTSGFFPFPPALIQLTVCITSSSTISSSPFDTDPVLNRFTASGSGWIIQCKDTQ